MRSTTICLRKHSVLVLSVKANLAACPLKKQHHRHGVAAHGDIVFATLSCYLSAQPVAGLSGKDADASSCQHVSPVVVAVGDTLDGDARGGSIARNAYPR